MFREDSVKKLICKMLAMIVEIPKVGISEEENGKTRGTLVEVFREDSVKIFFFKKLAIIVKNLGRKCEGEKGKTRGTLVEVFREDSVKK